MVGRITCPKTAKQAIEREIEQLYRLTAVLLSIAVLFTARGYTFNIFKDFWGRSILKNNPFISI